MAVASPVTKALMAAVTAVVVLWLVVVVAWADAPFAITFDDAWYYVGIARNIHDGAGSTFDRVNVTNGYHPLWLLVCVGMFAVGLDGMAAERALLVLAVVSYGGALVVLVQVITRFTGGWPRVRSADKAASTKAGALLLAIVFAAVTGNPFVVKTFVNGLETGITVIFLAAVLWLGARAEGRFLTTLDRRERLLLSLMLTGAVLGRTDAAFLLATLAAWCAVEWLGERPRPTLAVLQLFAMPTIALLAYLAYNHLTYGHFLQVSGLVKRAEFGWTNGTMFVVGLVLAGALQRAGMRRTPEVGRPPAGPREGRFPRTGAFVQRTAWFGAFGIIVVAYYTTLQTQIWLWYFAPVVLYGIVLLTLATTDFAEEALRTARPGRSNRALAPVWGVLAVPMLVLFVVTGRQFTDPNLRSLQVANAEAGTWIAANIEPEARLASWDAGAIGYFSDAEVMNLDGVVNSRAYYQANQDGAGALRDFLRCRHLRYIVNHGDDIGGEDPDIRAFLRVVYGDEAAQGATIVYRLPFQYNGVTSGSAGTDDSGLRNLAVHVYELPAIPPTSAEGCPTAP